MLSLAQMAAVATALLCVPGVHAQKPVPEVERIARAALASGKIVTEPTQIEAGVPAYCKTFVGTFYGESPWWPRGSRVIVLHVVSLSANEDLLDQQRARDFIEIHGVTVSKPVCTGRIKRWASENAQRNDQPENSADYPLVVTVDPADGKLVALPLSATAKHFQRLKHPGSDAFEFAWVQGTLRRNKPYSAAYSRLTTPQ